MAIFNKQTAIRLIKSNALRKGLLGGHPLWRAIWVFNLLRSGWARISKGGEAPVTFSEPLGEGTAWTLVHVPEDSKRGRGDGRKLVVGPKRARPRATALVGPALSAVGAKILEEPSAERINAILGEEVVSDAPLSRGARRKVAKADKRTAKSEAKAAKAQAKADEAAARVQAKADAATAKVQAKDAKVQARLDAKAAKSARQAEAKAAKAQAKADTKAAKSAQQAEAKAAKAQAKADTKAAKAAEAQAKAGAKAQASARAAKRDAKAQAKAQAKAVEEQSKAEKAARVSRKDAKAQAKAAKRARKAARKSDSADVGSQIIEVAEEIESPS